jgi:hypothetical protein
MRGVISWRVPDNSRGVQSTTCAIGYYLRKFAEGHDLGCSVEWRPTATGLEIIIDGISEQVVIGEVAAALRKKVHNLLGCVGRKKRSNVVAQCKFNAHLSPPLARAEDEVLERIHGRVLPHSGFQSWWKFRPKPLAAADPAPVAVPAAVPAVTVVSVAPDAVAMALAADLVNLRSEYHGALGTNDFANGFDKAVGLLAIVLSFLQEHRGPGAATSVQAEPFDREPPAISESSLPKAPVAGSEKISNCAAVSVVPVPCSNTPAEGAAASVAAEDTAARGGLHVQNVTPEYCST